MNFEQVFENKEIRAYFEAGDRFLVAQNITRHNIDHAMIVSRKAGEILSVLGYEKSDVELAKIAGYMHDIGNVVNRKQHDLTGAILAHQILSKMEADPNDIAEIVGGIGNHDESNGLPVSSISAAVILADKSDVRRSRVRNVNTTDFDIHDRVNYAVIHSDLSVNKEKSRVRLDLTTDCETISIIEYFEIFLERMLMCKRAAAFLQTDFELVINGTKLM